MGATDGACCRPSDGLLRAPGRVVSAREVLGARSREDEASSARLSKERRQVKAIMYPLVQILQNRRVARAESPMNDVGPLLQ